MIEKKVKQLVRKFGTRNPFELADMMGAILIHAPLKGGTRGFYSYYKRNGIICVDSSLSEQDANFVCAHELGHYVLHRKENSVLLKNTTFLNTNKFEIQANRFAVNLLISDEDIKEMRILGYTLAQTASALGVAEEMLKMRLI